MDIIDLTKEGRYNDFANEVKEQMKAKLASNEVVSSYIKEVEKIQAQKEIYKSISGV